MRRAKWLLSGLLLVVLLGGLSLAIIWQRGHLLVDADQTARLEGQLLAIIPDSPVGQTFVARHAGLTGIEFYLAPHNSTPLTLTLHLRTGPESTTDLLSTAVSLPAQTEPGFCRFDFRPVTDSHGQYYYAFLDTRELGAQAATAQRTAYVDGAAYQAHEPLYDQTTFRLVYATRFVLLDLARAAVGWIPLLLVAGLAFALPGWALLTWLLPGKRPAWPVKLGLAVGLSLALYPIILLWAHVVGLHLGSAFAWLPIVIGLALLLWHNRNRRLGHARAAVQEWMCSDELWPDLTLTVILILIFAVRLLVVRTMETALWADSYEHTVMTQLLLDHGGLFDSWEPYTPYQSLTVHFGFPTAAAVLAWITGKSSTESVLLIGQLMNGFASLTLYPLAVRIAKGNRWAGVGAVLAAGILSPMPAFYVNWGRFAQLAGQAILPVALWLAWEAVERRRSAWRVALLAAITACGMALAYYRMPFYYVAFIIAWLLAYGLPQWQADIRSWARVSSRLLATGVVTAILLLPLAFRLAGGQLAAGLGAGITKTSPVQAVLQDYEAWRSIEYYIPIPLLMSTGLALVLGLVRRSRTVLATGLWMLALSALPAGRLIRLPGANYIQMFAIFIALYIPVSLLIGWLVAAAGDVLVRLDKRYVLPVVIVAISILGMSRQAKIVEPERILATRPDMQAMKWIKQNTPQDSLFLVEGYHYQNYSATGSDAGWWIPILADRATNMPPQYAILSETPIQPGYSKAVVDLVVQLGTIAPSEPAGIELLCDWGFTHVYIGQQQGEVGHGAEQLFSDEDLRENPTFTQVYRQDQVSIYAMDPEACRSIP